MLPVLAATTEFFDSEYHPQLPVNIQDWKMYTERGLIALLAGYVSPTDNADDRSLLEDLARHFPARGFHKYQSERMTEDLWARRQANVGVHLTHCSYLTLGDLKKGLRLFVKSKWFRKHHPMQSEEILVHVIQEMSMLYNVRYGPDSARFVVWVEEFPDEKAEIMLKMFPAN